MFRRTCKIQNWWLALFLFHKISQTCTRQLFSGLLNPRSYISAGWLWGIDANASIFKKKSNKKAVFFDPYLESLSNIVFSCSITYNQKGYFRTNTKQLNWFGFWVFLMFGRTQTLSALKSPPSKSGLSQV